MTTDMMTLQALLAKEPDADIHRDLLGFAAQRLMELEVERKTGTAHGERSPDRLVQRNGYRERNWETRVGTIDLQIPKLRICLPPRRRGKLFPGIPGATPDERSGTHAFGVSGSRRSCGVPWKGSGPTRGWTRPI
jgi:hypothetical protein